MTESSTNQPTTTEPGESEPDTGRLDDDVDGETVVTTDETATTDEDRGDGPVEPAPPARAGIAAGAAAVLGAGLGLASVTGTWLSDQMFRRQELIGQIKSQSDQLTPADQIAEIHGSPSHTTALFNGGFALAAIVVTAAVLLGAGASKRSSDTGWVRAVALGGLLLGVLGLAIAAVMWFDVFTDLPTVPEAPNPS